MIEQKTDLQIINFFFLIVGKIEKRKLQSIFLFEEYY